MLERIPDFEFYSLENSYIIDYYYYLTTFCQGGAFVCGVLYSFTDYRRWIFWGGGMTMLCLPVDVVIFYKEPIGMVGTMFAMVLGFVPFGIMIADAAFPETETVIITGGRATPHWRYFISLNNS